MEKIIVFNKHGNPPVVCKFTYADDTNVYQAFYQAIEDASADGYCGLNCDLPNKYLQAYGITMQQIESVVLDMTWIDPADAKVTLCRCNQCSEYDDGSCFHYGGCVDGFADSTECDCLVNCGGNQLYWNNMPVVTPAFDTELDPYQTALYLYQDTSEELAPLRDELREGFTEDGICILPPNDGTWEFRAV